MRQVVPMLAESELAALERARILEIEKEMASLIGDVLPCDKSADAAPLLSTLTNNAAVAKTADFCVQTGLKGIDSCSRY